MRDTDTASSPSPDFPPDFDRATIDLCRFVEPFTMTGPERIFALRRSVEYIVRHNIPGSIVECGVWKGGSMMAVARTLIDLAAADRDLYLFDTFDGMPEPRPVDRSFDGQPAADLLAADQDKRNSWIWACSPLDEVKAAMRLTGYDEARLFYVPGRVEVTIPESAPPEIALLRLDTDWYDSTRHELEHLYPRLATGGVLIIDDYGHWQGARQAVDEYLEANNLKMLLHRIDYTARICVKPGF